MRGYSVILLLLLTVPLVVNAQYWFQSGARAGTGSYYNSGAKVTIQTITPQNPKSGSLAFWVGENLNNDDFLQVGYLATNQTGLYPAMCTMSGCSQKEYLTKGAPEWFYEYFNSQTGAAFLGTIGPNDSAGSNDSEHTYGFYSKGNTWYFFMDNTTLGEVNLGTNNSGQNGPVAFAEVANASNPSTVINPVVFSNLSSFIGGEFLPAPQAYSYIGYGVGSESAFPNPYGVQELYNRVNYFEAGSNLSQPQNNQPLWQLGFNLNILSQYGNLSGINQYLAYHDVRIYAPTPLYLNSNSRVSFAGWTGYGIGQYTGPSPAQNITLYSNITEVANWNVQYLFNLTSKLGYANGYGWYNANSTVNYSVNQSEIYSNSTARWSFDGWSNGNQNASASIILSAPYFVQAIWQEEYLLNATSPLGTVNGTGWHPANTTARLTVSRLYQNISSNKRLAFYSWSNGDSSLAITITMTSPLSLHAIFMNQSLVSLSGADAYGAQVRQTVFNIGNTSTNSSLFLFDNHDYKIASIYYKGTELHVNQSINVSGPSNLTISLPIYDVQVRTTDVFGIPVNVSTTTTFLNGTTLSGYSGSAGIVEVPDVPYGAASVAVRYGSENLVAKASGGAIARITVVSALDLSLFIIVILIAFGIYFIASHRIRHHNPRSETSNKRY